jgi:phospholipid/cholesterol/gamma-HCH transport system substrate-binding protein
MTERQIQFRVGLFVLVALAAAGVMIFQFGRLRRYFEPGYAVAIHFDSAAGLHPSAPVRRNGIRIGVVREIGFDEQSGGVLVLVEINSKHHVRIDAQPMLVRSLLGDAGIEFTPGKRQERVKSGDRLEGVQSPDPMQMVEKMQVDFQTTLKSFDSTSKEWRELAVNMNSLLKTNHGKLDDVVEQTAVALAAFTRTMGEANKALASANVVLGDPKRQESMKRTLDALPALLEETRDVIVAAKSAVGHVDDNLENLKDVTGPLAKHSRSIVIRLDNTLANMESISSELNSFTKLLAKKDGSIQKLVSDPELYKNLNDSAASLSVLLRNVEPIARDLRIFSDKIARHPELIGVSGAIKGSSGVKNAAEQPSKTPRGAIRQTGGVKR